MMKFKKKQIRSLSTVRYACSPCNDCILLNEVTPSVERLGHRDALSSSATIMIAWQEEAMRGHFFVAWLVRPPRATKQCSSPLCALDGSMSFESRGSRQALSEVERKSCASRDHDFQAEFTEEGASASQLASAKIVEMTTSYQVGQVGPPTQYQRTQMQVTDEPKLVNSMPAGLEQTSPNSTTNRMRRQ